jgi:dienelactone hydrolase
VASASRLARIGPRRRREAEAAEPADARGCLHGLRAVGADLHRALCRRAKPEQRSGTFPVAGIEICQASFDVPEEDVSLLSLLTVRCAIKRVCEPGRLLERFTVASLDRAVYRLPDLAARSGGPSGCEERSPRHELRRAPPRRLVHRAIKAAVVVGCAAALLLPAEAAPGTPIRLVLPRPSGTQLVGVRVLRWIDPSRFDPFAPGRRHRELRITIWYPAAARGHGGLARYMPTGVARVFERLNGAPRETFAALRTNSYVSAPVARGRFPVVLFSPAFGLSSALYTSLLEDLAARGYVVVATDPTYETFAVEFPGGRILSSHLPSGPNVLPRALAVRVADMRFVLDRLAILDRKGRFAGKLALDHVGMLGHSFGGATAANTALVDPRLRAAADLDGSILGPVVGQNLRIPFMIVTSSGAYRQDPTLQSLWAHLRGPRFNLTVPRSGHYTFSDLVALLPEFGPAVPPGLQYEAIGRLRASRAIPAVRTCVEAFFDRFLRGRHEPLLDRSGRLLRDLRTVAAG